MSGKIPNNTPYGHIINPSQKSGMFTFLLTSVILGAGTYMLYKYLFSKDEDEEEEYPQPYNTYSNDSNDDELKEDDDNNGFPLKIFYGSQSGTAEGFAFDMQKESKKYGFKTEVIDLEDYDCEELQEEQCVIFLVATYGEGEPTDNAQEFYNWLSSSDRIENDELENIEFAVFGLGNSQYEFFCEMGKQFDLLLQKLGGTRLIERGISDDDLEPPEDQFNEWTKKLWPILCEKYLGTTIDMSEQSAFENTITIEYIYKTEDEKENENENNIIYEMVSNVKYPFTVQYNKNLKSKKYSKYFNLLQPFRKPHWVDNCVTSPMIIKREARRITIDGSTLHVEFDITNVENDKFHYRTADNLGICVRNDYKLVSKLCKRLNINQNNVIKIEPIDNKESLKFNIPKVTTIRNLFLWHLDITELPRKGLIASLSQFATDDGDKAELKKLAETGVKNEFSNFYKILDKYKSIDIDLATVIELLRPLQPRLFTIASSNKVQPKQIAALAKMEFEFETPFEYSSLNLSKINLKELEEAEESKSQSIQNLKSLDELNISRVSKDDLKNSNIYLHENDYKHKFEGVCSHYLNISKENEIFQIYIQPSTFHLPAHNIPVIMISIGAGLAPFKAFLQEGNNLIKSGKHKINEFGEWWCIFGCRSEKIDYIYKNELESSLIKNGGCLKELLIAFSRDQENKKIYVQDIIDKKSEELWNLISTKNAHIYVCGGVAMGKAVRATFQRIFDFYNKGNGQEYLDDMLKKNIYIQELWG